MKGRGKRGQTEWYIIGIILAVVVLVLLVIGPVKFFTWIGNIFGLAPNNQDTMSTACMAYSIDPNLKAESTYCEIRKVTLNGVSTYANCDHLKTTYDTEFEDSTINCVGKEKEFCKTQKDDLVVNGKKCYENGDPGIDWDCSKAQPAGCTA